VQFIVQGYPAYAYTGGKPYDPSRPAIVFIHGAALDHSVWQWQSRYFAHHGYGVLAVDLPAHGRSPGSPRDSIGALADWVAAFIEAAGHERAHVVGHSMGALVALETALRHPQRVDHLALLGIALPMAVNDAFLAAANDDSPAGFEMQTTWSHARDSLLSSSPVPGLSLAGASRQLNARARSGVQHAGLRACNAYAPSAEALRALRAPTLVIAGKRDQMTPAKAGEAVAKQVRGARFVALDAGHSLMNEAPHATREALARFLPAAQLH
jgi:pimeloyl-ACP methyl ester carboxylesterase